MKNLSALSILLMALAISSCKSNNFFEAMDSITKIGDNAFYMEFKGDDGVDAFLAHGGVSNNEELVVIDSEFISNGIKSAFVPSFPAKKGACSELCTNNSNGERVIGRNFDWNSCDVLTLKIEPSNGYKSISTVNINFIGLPYGTQFKSFKEKMYALAAIMTPMDGINEKGLTIAINAAGDAEVPEQDTDKPDLTYSTAVRVILDKAANVEEALDILSQYDMHAESAKADEVFAFHFIIADASGRNVCVEWVKDKMVVTETNIMTNHYLCEEKRDATLYGTGDCNSFERFGKLSDADATWNGCMPESALTDAMASIAPAASGDFGGTQWTAIYNMHTLSGTWYYHRSFDAPFTVSL